MMPSIARRITMIAAFLLIEILPRGAVASDAVRNVWVEVGPPNAGIVRALTEGADCPVARFDGRTVSMNVRAAPNSDFDILVCEAEIPPGTHGIEVAGRRLRPVPEEPKRIVVIGDTGCRMKAGGALDDGFQACNDPDDWEFAKVAEQVASLKPDLIVYVGDYIYREQACDTNEQPGCAGSPFNSPGMRLETWMADFFDPATPMLEAAPNVFIRGDHEKCERAGQGYFRFLDPRPFDGGCTDFSDPYALYFQGLQLVIMDTVQAEDLEEDLSTEVVLDRYAADFEAARELVGPNTWLASHRPIWGLRPAQENDGSLELQKVNASVQEALARSQLRGKLPAGVQLVLTSHIHVAEVLSFTGDRPPDIVVGTGGTKLLPAVTEGLEGTLIDGEYVTHGTMLSRHGFFTFRPRGRNAWRANILGEIGQLLARCRLANKEAICRVRE